MPYKINEALKQKIINKLEHMYIHFNENYTVGDMLIQLSFTIYRGHTGEVIKHIAQIYNILKKSKNLDINTFLTLIEAERERQNKMYDNTDIPYEKWTLIILEEYGELVKDYNNDLDIQTEAIQLASLLVRFIEEY